ncbi:DUF2498 family protein [Candidatus Symbiopectobacterium endolongispinus]|nr:DUF2498 family protein [Candidatus Symbiopectobacterium sp. PLON1]MBT9428550.1 DUF2498 family protein [Candidatus Symbiopectobacterium endolongispinus]
MTAPQREPRSTARRSWKGDYFLDDNGLPTLKTTAVFNMLKHLAHELSEKYQLID